MAKKDKEDEDIGHYLGILTIVNPENMDSQCFVIEDVAVASLPVLVKDLGRNVYTVKNTLLQKSRKLDPHADYVKAFNRGKKFQASGAPWPMFALVLLLSSVLTSAVTYLIATPTKAPTSVKKEEGEKKKTIGLPTFGIPRRK